MKRALSLLLVLAPIALYAQCLTGVISASGPGCGCLSGCDLTAYGGPDCGGGVGGNCTGGAQSISVAIPLAPTCEVTVEARMATRPGCSASGADNGDALSVRNSSGSSTWQTGASNSTLFATHTQTGGSVTVEGVANRADEIITYEVYYQSGDCPFCLFLPVELIEFNAHLEANEVYLQWVTASELNNHGFYIQISRDGQSYTNIAFVEGAGTSQQLNRYTQQASLPGSGLWYLRLAQTDYDGTVQYSPVLALRAKARDVLLFGTHANGVTLNNTSEQPLEATCEVFNLSGQLVSSTQTVLDPSGAQLIEVPKGMHLVRVLTREGEIFTQKISR